MALKPTIYKFSIFLSDMNRNLFDTLNLTVAQHPSETIQRMMARVLAYCMNVDAQLIFSKGLSNSDEPDIWLHGLDNQLLLWIDVGEPAPERIKKASRAAKVVKVYSFNAKSPVWWQQQSADFSKLGVEVFRFNWQGIQALAQLVERSSELSITLAEDSAYISGKLGECEVCWQTLQKSRD